LRNFLKKELLYKRSLDWTELAKVEEKLDRLQRVIVMADKVDEPTDALREAVEDNMSTGVRYLFLVSHRTPDKTIQKYNDIFKQLEICARARDHSKIILGKSPVIKDDRLFSFHKLKQDWIDYPYVCYEYQEAINHKRMNYLMYRGDELGVGIAKSYRKITPETAYSLICRADALKNYMNVEPDQFSDGTEAGLSNVVAMSEYK
jgi:hypothetical protein